MQNSFVIDTATKESLRNKTLLFDTNALLDAYRLPIAFYDLAQEFEALGCDRVTTRTIIIEFLGGTTDKQAIMDKQLFLEELFGNRLVATYLPMDRIEPDLDDLLAFNRQANKFSVPDYELYCQLLKYRSNIALLTRNHKDFSAKLCNRISFITLLGDKEIHTHGVYSIA